MNERIKKWRKGKTKENENERKKDNQIIVRTKSYIQRKWMKENKIKKIDNKSFS